MEKKTLVEKLQKEGYGVTLEGNVPIFTISDKLTVEQITKLLQKYDYAASFGYRKVAGSGDAAAASAKTQKAKEALIEEAVEEPLFESMPDFQAETDGQYSFF